MTRRANDAKAIRAILRYMDGAVKETGGGCTAIVFDIGHSEVVITSAQHELTAPTRLDEPVQSGLYFKEDDGDAEVTNFATLRDALADLYGRCEGEVVPEVLAPLFPAEAVAGGAQ